MRQKRATEARSAITVAMALLLSLLVGVATQLRAQVIISEFMASNDRALADENGEFPDWIEVYNAGAQAVDLAGYALTDSPDEAKWSFPAMEIAAGEFLVVFASSKDRRDPSSELHTNFALSSSGEFVGLLENGNLVSTFGAYPAQLPDVSYGVAMEFEKTSVVESGHVVRYHIPENGDLGLGWTEVDFDDSSWTSGPTGVGFDQRPSPTFDEMIETDVGEEMRRVNASIYIRIPFEVESPSGSLDLRMTYDDGFVAYVNGREVARRNVSGEEISWNSNADRSRGAVAIEEITISQHGLSAGTNVLAIHGLNYSASGNDLLMLPELGLAELSSLETETHLYFPGSSPGQPNSTGWPGVAAPPGFSHEDGGYTEGFFLELSLEEEGAEIRFTINGAEPTESSELYTGPIDIRSTARVRARSFVEGLLPSRTIGRVYVFLSESVLGFDSNLPILIVDADRTIGEDNFTAALIAEIDGEEGRNSMRDAFSLVSEVGIKSHGSSAINFDKKSYRIETQDERGQDRNVPLLGMPSESDWVLHGPFSDKSLMRNSLAYRWSREIGWFAPRSRYCELYLKTGGGQVTPSHYWGVYLLVERIKLDAERVNIQRLLPTHTEEPEISGGYILKKDRLDPGDSGIRTSRGQILGFVEPKEREVTPQQRAWVLNWFREFESALYGGNFRDPEVGYAKYIDIPSWIDHHIVVETFRNHDGFRLSTHMFKDREGKLVMGPAWDYNLSLGNTTYFDGWLPEGWYHPYIDGQAGEDGANRYPWYPRLFEDPHFRELYRDRWIELRSGFFATQSLLSSIGQHADLLEEAQERNFQKWRILGRAVWPNTFIANTWHEEIDWIANWLEVRLDWMDEQFDLRPPELSHQGGVVAENFELTITSHVGEAYYTLNGPDPRTPEGELAPEAILYGDPIVITENTRVRVRSRYGEGGWTGLVEGMYLREPLPLVVTEIMYNPPEPGPKSEFNRRTLFEFIEFQNVGQESIDLTEVRLDSTQGLNFDFTNGDVTSLAPGEFVVAVQDTAAFVSKYGSENINIAGELSGFFSNNGMDLSLLSFDVPFLEFQYEDWYPETDGQGHSLVIRDPRAPVESWSEQVSWRPSVESGGSPGGADVDVVGVGPFQRGDCDQDGDVHITDGIFLLRSLFLGGRKPECVAACDMNSDGAVPASPTDALVLFRYLFLGGTPLGEPLMACGSSSEPGDVALTCETARGCEP